MSSLVYTVNLSLLVWVSLTRKSKAQISQSFIYTFFLICNVLLIIVCLVFRTCPNDLKEAVASVLYASKRLTDVAELADVVKHFSAKYGKDFVSAAVGLQPDSGVSRLVSCLVACNIVFFSLMFVGESHSC